MKKLKIMAILLSLVIATNVHAAVQIRPGVAVKGYLDIEDAFKLIRTMEAEGGALGLSATINSYSAKETSVANNIDSHLCKNTEWGAIAMLSASNYGVGNGKVISEFDAATYTYTKNASTTGNWTGVFGMNTGLGATELVAAGQISKWTSSDQSYLRYMDIRYLDDYSGVTSDTDTSKYIPGDATYEVKTLYSGAVRYSQYIVRGGGSIWDSYTASGVSADGISARACLWVGDGI